MGVTGTRILREFVTRFKSFHFLPQNIAPYGSTLIRWAIVGYIIRLVLMPLFPHRDPLTVIRVSFILKERHQLIPAVYPEPINYLYAFLFSVLDPFLSKGVFNDFFTNTAYTPDLLSLPFRLEPGVFTYLLILKMPFLVFDFLLGLILLRLFKEERQSLWAFKLWMINPISIYVTYIFGQYDVIPVFFIMLSLYFLSKEKTKSSMLSIGVAGTLKTFAFLFVLPIALFFVKRIKGFKEKVGGFLLLIAISLLPLVLSKIAAYFTPVYYLPTNIVASPFDVNGFFGNTLYLFGKPGAPPLIGLFRFTIDYSMSFKTFALFIDVIYVFPVIYTLLLLTLIYRNKMSSKTMWKAILVFLLLYHALSLFHPQWFIYAQPLLVLLVIEDFKFLKAYAILIPLYFVYTLYWAQETLAFIDSLGLSSIQVINIFRSMFSGVCIFIVALMVLPDNFIKKLRGLVSPS